MRMKAHSGERPDNDVFGREDILMFNDDANAEVEFTKGLILFRLIYEADSKLRDRL